MVARLNAEFCLIAGVEGLGARPFSVLGPLGAGKYKVGDILFLGELCGGKTGASAEEGLGLQSDFTRLAHEQDGVSSVGNHEYKVRLLSLYLGQSRAIIGSPLGIG